MNSRLTLIDLDVQLCLLQYGKCEEPYLESLHELLGLEFPEDKITMDELTEWASLQFEVEELERAFDFAYQEGEYERVED